MRRAARVDSSQAQIVEIARELGATVLLLHQVGGGCPDLLVGYERDGMRHNVLVEVKSKGGKLTSSQKGFFDTWRGQVAVVRSVNDMIALLTADFCPLLPSIRSQSTGQWGNLLDRLYVLRSPN